jgi:hypothetical protein
MTDPIPSHERTTILHMLGEYSRWEGVRQKAKISLQRGLGNEPKVYYQVRLGDRTVSGRVDTGTQAIEEVNRVVLEWQGQIGLGVVGV